MTMTATHTVPELDRGEDCETIGYYVWLPGTKTRTPDLQLAAAVRVWQGSCNGELCAIVRRETGEWEGGHQDRETGCWEGGEQKVNYDHYQYENFAPDGETPEYFWGDDPIDTETEWE